MVSVGTSFSLKHPPLKLLHIPGSVAQEGQYTVSIISIHSDQKKLLKFLMYTLQIVRAVPTYSKEEGSSFFFQVFEKQVL